LQGGRADKLIPVHSQILSPDLLPENTIHFLCSFNGFIIRVRSTLYIRNSPKQAQVVHHLPMANQYYWRPARTKKDFNLMDKLIGIWDSTPVAALPQDVKTAWSVVFKLLEDGTIEKDAPPEVLLEVLLQAYGQLERKYTHAAQMYTN
jgi:hypothetical protein